VLLDLRDELGDSASGEEVSALAIQIGWQNVCTCCSCGVEFASPLLAKRREDGKLFYCPNGHQQHFTDTTELRLQRELENTKRDLDWQRSQRETAEKRLIAQRGQTTKAKNKLKRVSNGVCPCCNRTFQNLMRHMDTKHPEF
jgi:hypothetical protein